jgi:hypothetical protein
MHAVSDFPDYALDKRESLAELASMARAGCDHDRAVPLEGSIAAWTAPSSWFFGWWRRTDACGWCAAFLRPRFSFVNSGGSAVLTLV